MEREIEREIKRGIKKEINRELAVKREREEQERKDIRYLGDTLRAEEAARKRKRTIYRAICTAFIVPAFMRLYFWGKSRYR